VRKQFSCQDFVITIRKGRHQFSWHKKQEHSRIFPSDTVVVLTCRRVFLQHFLCLFRNLAHNGLRRRECHDEGAAIPASGIAGIEPSLTEESSQTAGRGSQGTLTLCLLFTGTIADGDGRPAGGR
jgi:hypothetical protein